MKTTPEKFRASIDALNNHIGTLFGEQLCFYCVDGSNEKEKEDYWARCNSVEAVLRNWMVAIDEMAVAADDRWSEDCDDEEEE